MTSLLLTERSLAKACTRNLLGNENSRSFPLDVVVADVSVRPPMSPAGAVVFGIQLLQPPGASYTLQNATAQGPCASSAAEPGDGNPV